MTINLTLFPQGRSKALTMSYDDGVVEDRRLVEIFNRHGIRGTFHLNSTRLDKPPRLAASEVAALYAGHEISAHAATHPFLDDLPDIQIIQQMLDDRRALEALAGYPVRGMSYPFGTYNQRVLDLLPAAGIEYSRTVASTGNFGLPTNPITWHPTCHHKNNLMELTERFLGPSKYKRAALFYVWGHSYEFRNDNNWELIEGFCGRVGKRDDIWYATNIEIIDYLEAVRRLRFSVACDRVQNPSSRAVWILRDEKAVEIPPGATVSL